MSEPPKHDPVSGVGESETSAPVVDSPATPERGGLWARLVPPADVLWRAGILLVVLCLLKAVMLVSLRKYLFDAYWRVGVQPYSWVNVTAFYLFAILIGLNLWKLARHYEEGGARAIRPINLLVLVLSSLFIALSFHEGMWNHLYPLMHGTLGFRDLGPYYSLNFFFRPPFLFVWGMAYAAVYYILARTGREHLMLRVTAAFATVYTALCLRDLRSYREELIVADALGLACFLIPRREPNRLPWLWVLLPLICLVWLYWLFRPYADALSSPVPECIVLVAASVILFVGSCLLAWRRGFYAGWSWFVVFAGVSFLLFVNANYPLSANYRNLMCVALTLPRYFVGEFVVTLSVLALALAFRRWRPAGSLWWMDGLNIALILLTLVDVRLVQIMGARLDWNLLSLALGEGPKMMWRMARPYLPLVGLLLGGVVIVYVLALRGLRRYSRQRAATAASRQFHLAYAVTLCLLLALAGRWALGKDKALGETAGVLAQSSPWWRRSSTPVLSQEQFIATANRLGMTSLASRTYARAASTGENARNLNVVFIFLESTYDKYLSLFGCAEDTQPLVSEYRNRMELFPNFYSSYAGSINARFASFTGLYPVRDFRQFTQQRVGVKSLFEVLHDHGYSNALFYSSFFDYTGFRDFLRGREIGDLYDASNMPGKHKENEVSWGLREDDTLAAMREWIHKSAGAGQKFCLTYIPAAPHNPFDGTPQRFRKYHLQHFHDYTPLYLNELLYMDWVVKSMLDELKEDGILDRTLVVITGDHGEMLGAGGGPIGHGWALTPELANVPLIIMDPDRRGCRINDTVGSQVDILPTILDKLGIPLPPNQLYQGASLYSTNAEAGRVIYLNTFRQYAIVDGRTLFFGDREVDAGTATGSHRQAYTIENEGAHTTYLEAQKTPPDSYSMSDFDQFQANLLHNYSRYCRMMDSGRTAMSSRSK